MDDWIVQCTGCVVMDRRRGEYEFVYKAASSLTVLFKHYFLHHAIAFTVFAPYSAKMPVVRDIIEAQNESSGRKLDTTWQVANV